MIVKEDTVQSVIDHRVPAHPGLPAHRLILGDTVTDRWISTPKGSSIAKERFIHTPPLILDRHKRLITLTTDPTHVVDLTKGEAAILTCLMLNPNRVLSCYELATKALGSGPGADDPETLIRPYIFRLRRKIEPDSKSPQLICTVRRKGYRFASPQEVNLL